MSQVVGDGARPGRAPSFTCVRTGSRRKLDVALLGVGGLVLAGVGGCAAFVANTEHINAMWVGAALQADGGAAITEVIDYDFGAYSRHGIFRDLPDLPLTAPVRAESATAPDAVRVMPAPSGAPDPSATRIRIGDPDTTVSGNHRYQVDYRL